MTTLVAPRPLAAAAPARSGWRPVRRAAVPVGLVAAWALVSAAGWAPAAVLPGPGAVVAAAAEIAGSGMLGTYLQASLLRIAAGVGVGAGAGLVLGLLAGVSTLGEELVDSTLQILRAVPFLAMIPLFIAWFGIDEPFKVAVIAFAVVVPMYTYTFLAVRAIDAKVLEAARCFDVTGARLVAGVVLPQALPGILMAVRVCLAVAVTALVAAENVGTREGIGYLVAMAREYNRVDHLFVCLVLYALLGVAFDALVRVAEAALLPWRPWVAR